MKQLLRIAIFTVIGSSIRQALRRFHSFSNGIAVACKLSWVKLVDSVFYWNLRRLYLVYCLFYFSTRSSSRAMQYAKVLFYHDNFKFCCLIGLQAFSFYFLTFMKNNLLIVRTIYFEFVLEVSILSSTEPKGAGFRKYPWLYVPNPALASKLYTEQMWTKFTTNMHLGSTNEKNTYSSRAYMFNFLSKSRR